MTHDYFQSIPLPETSSFYHDLGDIGLENSQYEQQSRPYFENILSSSETTVCDSNITKQLPPPRFADVQDNSHGQFFIHDDEDPSPVLRFDSTSHVQPKFKRLSLVWRTAMITCIVSTFAVFYSYRALVNLSALPKHLALPPGKTVLVVNILSHVVAFLCWNLFVNTSEALRWAIACRPEKGILVTSFLTLSRATSLAGIWNLIAKGGTHQFWCIVKLLSMALHTVVGLILITDITFKNVYTSQNPTPPINVLAGVAPLNSQFISIVPPEILNAFASSYIMGFLTDPRFVTSIDPVSCTKTSNCSSVTSIFLPGGLDLVRIDNGNVTATLFDSAQPGDAVLINGAPGYQVEFSLVDPNFRFKSSDCDMYMKSLGDGLYICATSNSTELVIGWAICPTGVTQCATNTTWTQTLDQTTAVSVYKRYATTAYDLKNQSILSIESISSPQPAPMNLTIFTQYISMVLGPVPEILNYSDVEAYKSGATRYAVQFGWGWILRLYKDDFNTYTDGGLQLLQSMMAIPLQFSTVMWQQVAESTLPPDMKVNATIVTSSYRALAPAWTVYSFAIMAFVLWVWSIACIVWMFFLGPDSPKSSNFPEIDIMSKSNIHTATYAYTGPGEYGFQSGFGGQIQRGVENQRKASVIDNIRKKKIYCGAYMDPRTGERTVVIVTKKGAVSLLKEHDKYA